MSNTINISGLNRGAVLAALYNASRPLGMGFLQFTPEDMTAADGERIVTEIAARCNGRVYVDYLKGRVMKVNLSSDTFDPWLYDRDNGDGAAADVVTRLRQSLAA